MIQNKKLGKWAEQQAWIYLKNIGYRLVAKNYHSRFGEIDLITTCGNSLIFIEVKARGISSYGRAHEVVTLAKQKKIIQTALVFLTEFSEFSQYYCRFDVMCFDLSPSMLKTGLQQLGNFYYDLNWIENAFTFDAEFINL